MIVTVRAVHGLVFLLFGVFLFSTRLTLERRQHAIRYNVTDIGVLPGCEQSGATALNDRGQIVGWSGDQYRNTHAFLWQNEKIRDLGALHGDSSEARGINNRGQVVGWSGVWHRTSRAVLWQNGRIRDLGVLTGSKSDAYGINNRGEVVGWSDFERPNSNMEHGFLWKKGQMKDLGTVDGRDYSGSMAFAINDTGEIVGDSRFINDFYAMIYKDGIMSELRTFGGRYNSAVAINSSGQIVGSSGMTRSRDYYEHACLWQGGEIIDLGTLGGGKSRADSINEAGQVVGWSYRVDDNKHNSFAFLWEHGVMRDLNELISPDAHWLLTEARAMNSTGSIVGMGFHDGHRHGFLLTPIDAAEPAGTPEGLDQQYQ